MTSFTPSLRAYAGFLLGASGDADDLVQETLLRAWRYRGSFRSHSHPKAWLFQILRNEFLSWVSRRRPIEDVDGRFAARMTVRDNQELSVHCSETLRALQRLTPRSREVLALVAAGVSYEEAAEICRCSVGTLKSRINRARASLFKIMDGGDHPGSEPLHVATGSHL